MTEEDREPFKTAERAILQVSTNGFPLLLQMLTTEDSKFKIRIRQFLNRSLGIRKHYIAAVDTRQVAVCGFAVLGEIGRPAIPKMLRLLPNVNAPVRAGIISAIEALGPFKSFSDGLVQTFIFYLDDPDRDVRDSAVRALRVCHADADLAKAALLNCLDNTRTPLFRLESVFLSLELLSEEAETVSAIEKFLEYPYPRIALAAYETLRRIRSHKNKVSAEQVPVLTTDTEQSRSHK